MVDPYEYKYQKYKSKYYDLLGGVKNNKVDDETSNEAHRRLEQEKEALRKVAAAKKAADEEANKAAEVERIKRGNEAYLNKQKEAAEKRAAEADAERAEDKRKKAEGAQRTKKEQDEQFKDVISVPGLPGQLRDDKETKDRIAEKAKKEKDRIAQKAKKEKDRIAAEKANEKEKEAADTFAKAREQSEKDRKEKEEKERREAAEKQAIKEAAEKGKDLQKDNKRAEDAKSIKDDALKGIPSAAVQKTTHDLIAKLADLLTRASDIKLDPKIGQNLKQLEQAIEKINKLSFEDKNVIDTDDYKALMVTLKNSIEAIQFKVDTTEVESKLRDFKNIVEKISKEGEKDHINSIKLINMNDKKVVRDLEILKIDRREINRLRNKYMIRYK